MRFMVHTQINVSGWAVRVVFCLFCCLGVGLFFFAVWAGPRCVLFCCLGGSVFCFRCLDGGVFLLFKHPSPTPTQTKMNQKNTPWPKQQKTPPRQRIKEDLQDPKFYKPLCEPLSKLLVSPLITIIVVPYIIPYVTPFKEFRL